MRLLIISGQSGAGKSVALHALEDLGYYAIDNLPLRLLPELAAEIGADDERVIERVAAVIDVRSPARSLAEIGGVLERIGALDVETQVLFLEADRETLLKRFSETRRRHPLTRGDTPLSEALEREAALLAPIRARAGIVIDTSHTHVHQLRALVQERVGLSAADEMSLLFQSFGFKQGAPRDADMVFDVRCLPNPYWQPSLRSLSGRDAAVAWFLEQSPLVGELTKSLEDFLRRWIPRFQQESRAYLSVAIGCTGGRHRSVYIVERLARAFREDYPTLIVRHRELES